MEVAFFSLINKLIEHGFISSFPIELITLTAIFLVYRFILKPIHLKIEKMPTLEENLAAFACVEERDEEHFNEIEELLKKLVQLLDELCNTEKNNTREINEIRRDIEHVKQILNQFQGHMLYGADRRTSDFGNKELR